MNTIEAILTRRSIRAFKPEMPTESQVETLLKSAMYAPSARNQQLWDFVVIDDAELLRSLAAISPSLKPCEYAPMAILVCGDISRAKSPDFWQHDCAAATQNLLLAAHDLGLGAVWMGVFPRESRVTEITSLVHLPEEVFPFSLIAVGYPNETPQQPDRYLPKRVFRNKWGVTL